MKILNNVDGNSCFIASQIMNPEQDVQILFNFYKN